MRRAHGLPTDFSQCSDPVFHDPGHRSSQSLHLPHDFRYHPNHLTYGAFDDRCYDHLRIFAWTVELWDVLAQAGIKDRKFIDWYRKKQE